VTGTPDLQPVPGVAPAVFVEEDIDLHICGHCWELRYPRRAEEQHESQWCRCDRLSQNRPAPTWGDLRSRRRLCWCCSIESADGGSKWTVHTCHPCMLDIQEVNRVAQRLVAPIGMHSMMHGIGARLDGDTLGPEVAEALAGQLNRMFAGTRGAHLHGRFRTAELCRRFGLYGRAAIPTSEYLAAAQDQVQREGGLTSLVTFMQDPLVWSAQNPEHRPLSWGTPPPNWAR
jgi:hypothetical protein